MIKEGLSLREAALYVKRHVRTLQKWDRDGVLPALRTKTNRRYWLKEQLDAFLGQTEARPTRRVAYCRVSDHAQKSDLRSQRACIETFCLSTGRSDVDYICEVGGGLNFKRKEFLTIVDSIIGGGISELIVAHKDRLTRFGFELMQHLCETHDVKLVVVNIEETSPEQEVVNDLMTIVHCFSSRLYGLRNCKKAIKTALECK